jgi:dienelactone hydrolase
MSAPRRRGPGRNAWPAGLVLAALGAVGCAALAPQFPPEPRPGTLFHAFAQPAGPGPFPAVVLLHTCAGVRPHLFTWMLRLNAGGYAALIVDSFTPRGMSACAGRERFPAELEEVADDALRALEHLRSRPRIDGRRIAVVGFSYGASAALRLASPQYQGGGRRFGAAVAFYPLCAPYPGGAPHRSDNLRDVATPTLILMGAADTDTPGVVENCVARVERLRAAGRPVDIQLFPGAGHVFDVHHPQASRAAAVAMLAFLDQHLGPAGPGR